MAGDDQSDGGGTDADGSGDGTDGDQPVNGNGGNAGGGTDAPADNSGDAANSGGGDGGQASGGGSGRGEVDRGRTEDTEGVLDLPFAAGAFAGVFAFVLGYLITYVATNSAIRNSVIGDISGNEVWRAVGWVFYNAHYIDTVGELSVLGIEISRAANFVNEFGAFPTWLFFVPPVLLLAAGAVIAFQSAAEASLAFAVKSGLTVVPGYFVVTLVGAFLFRLESGNRVVGPEPVTAAFLGGLIYPIVFAVIGALLVSVVYGPRRG